MKNTRKSFVLGILVILVFSFAAFGQKGETREKRIKFARGKSSATVKGVITDRMETHLYRVGVRAGQTVTIAFSSPRKDIDVCVHTPDNQDFCEQRKYSLKMKTDGDIEILVDGHRENIRYTLTVSVK